jgi:hypothetical protein
LVGSSDVTEEHRLSRMLTTWRGYKVSHQPRFFNHLTDLQTHQVVAWTDAAKLTDAGKNLQSQLGDKGIEAVKDLASVRM